MKTLAEMIDWNGFIEVGIPLWIAAIGSAAATIISSLNRRNSKTSNGHTLGEMVEQTHAIATASAAALGVDPEAVTVTHDEPEGAPHE